MSKISVDMHSIMHCDRNAHSNSKHGIIVVTEAVLNLALFAGTRVARTAHADSASQQAGCRLERLDGRVDAYLGVDRPQQLLGGSMADLHVPPREARHSRSAVFPQPLCTQNPVDRSRGTVSHRNTLDSPPCCSISMRRIRSHIQRPDFPLAAGAVSRDHCRIDGLQGAPGQII